MNRVYTLGYGWRTREEVDALLKAHEAVLADIRFSPRSRRPEWNKGQLEAFFGNRYFPLAGFGNSNYKGSGGIVLADPDEAFVQLQDRLIHSSVVMMCACREYHSCHRKTVSDWLNGRGIETEELEFPQRPPKLNPQLSLLLF